MTQYKIKVTVTGNDSLGLLDSDKVYSAVLEKIQEVFDSRGIKATVLLNVEEMKK